MTDKVALALFRQFVRKGTITISVGLGKPVVITGDILGPNVSVHIKNSAVLRRIVAKPDIAIGESYMDNSLIIENDDLESLMQFLFENSNQWRQHLAGRMSLFMNKRLAFLHHWNLPGVSRRNVAHHYDLTDALFDSFLDPRRQYSCGYYEHPDVGITDAQNTKLARIAAKLHLSKGDQILDIGCGWGGLANALIDCDPDVHVSGITLSTEQLAYAKRMAAMANREGNLDFQLRDYRHQRGSFDKIVSVGMLEHVGPRNFNTYFGTIKRLLAPKGIAVIHTVGVNDNPAPVNRWQGKYIFPGGYVPSFQQMVSAITNHRIQILDVEVMRLHYAETLRDWRLKFIQNIDMVRAIYDDRFIRMWKFYLVGCEYFFRCQHGMVFQFQIAHDQTAAPVNRRYMTELQDKFWEKLCQANNSGNIKRSVR